MLQIITQGLGKSRGRKEVFRVDEISRQLGRLGGQCWGQKASPGRGWILGCLVLPMQVTPMTLGSPLLLRVSICCLKKTR